MMKTKIRNFYQRCCVGNKYFVNFLSRLIWNSILVTLLSKFTSCERKNWHQSSDGRDNAIVIPALPELTDLAEEVRPAVFSIEVINRQGAVVGTGTGFSISSKGLMVTNRHVIQRAKTITVLSDSGGRYEAKGVVAYDRDRDLVVIQLVGKNFPHLKLPNSSSDEVRVGEAIAVFGSPLGLAGTLSDGIVSAIRSDVENNDQVVGLIQISAPISPGSSGSPVLRMNGEVIGVATLASQEGSQNLNFAIPTERLSHLKYLDEIVDFADFMNVFYQSEIRESSEFNRYQESVKTSELDDLLDTSRALVEKFPSNPEAYYYLANSLRKFGRFEEARVCSERLLEIDPDSVRGWRSLGYSQQRIGEIDAAIRSFETAIELDPDDSVSWESLGGALRQNQNYARAEEALKKSLELDSTSVSAWHDLGLSLVQADKHRDALSPLEMTVMLDPQYVEAWCDLGSLRASLFKLRDAAEAFRKAVTVDPDCAIGWSGLGSVLNEMGYMEEAGRAYGRAVRIDSDNPGLRIDHAKALDKGGKIDEAIRSYRETLDLTNDPFLRSRAWQGIGDCLSKKDDIEGAVKSYRKSVTHWSENWAAWIGLGIGMVKSGNPEECIVSFRKALSLKNDKNQQELMWSLIRRGLEQGGYADNVSSYCKRAIKEDNANEVIFYLYGLALFEKSQYAEAISAFKASIELQPNEFDSWCGLGLALCMNNNYDDGVSAIRRAIDTKKIKQEAATEEYRELGMEELNWKVEGRNWSREISNLRIKLSGASEHNINSKVLKLLMEYNSEGLGAP